MSKNKLVEKLSQERQTIKKLNEELKLTESLVEERNLKIKMLKENYNALVVVNRYLTEELNNLKKHAQHFRKLFQGKSL